MFRSLISRIILFNVLLLVLGVSIFTLFHLHREQAHLIATTRQHANMLLGTIEKSIFTSMRLGKTSEVQAILETVGHGHGITGVRIFSPAGIVLTSADPDEIGSRVDGHDFSLFTGNVSEGTFREHKSGRVLSMVRPIVSDERCFGCHGNGRRVIGVLNLNFSLSEMYLQLRETSQLFVISTFIILGFLAAGISVVMIRFLRRPLEKITQCMAQVEDGDLTVRLQPVQDDEIGQLMNGFNAMVGNLSRAQSELEKYHYQQMERVDRLASVGEMAAGLAHEIKNPLAGISGAISVLSDDYAEGDQRREIMQQIQNQIGRLDKTVNDLLYFGKPGLPEFAFADINDLLKQTLLFVAQHPESKNINRIDEMTRDLPAVWIDCKQLQQVILNISLNAVQAMTEGGILTVVTDQIQSDKRDWVRIRISDTGPGITAEVRAKIFTPFFTTKTQGTGLGLPICRQLMEHNGGSLEVESELGKGTEFSLLLPVRDDRPEK